MDIYIYMDRLVVAERVGKGSESNNKNKVW